MYLLTRREAILPNNGLRRVSASVALWPSESSATFANSAKLRTEGVWEVATIIVVEARFGVAARVNACTKRFAFVPLKLPVARTTIGACKSWSASATTCNWLVDLLYTTSIQVSRENRNSVVPENFVVENANSSYVLTGGYLGSTASREFKKN